MSDRIEINVTVNGKSVPLSDISMETIGKIRDAEKEEPIYIGAIFREHNSNDWMLFYDYATNGLNLVGVTKGSYSCGKTYSGNSLPKESKNILEGFSEEEIKRHFNYISYWKLIERGKR